MTLAASPPGPAGTAVPDATRPERSAARAEHPPGSRTEAPAALEVVDLSVVIPAHNEESRITTTLAAIAADLAERPERCEILVVDDGSTDRTAAIASKMGVRVLRLPVNRGKGAAVRAGVGAARGRFILVTDADLSTPIGEYATLRRALDDGAGVAIGSRAVVGAQITRGQPVHRRAMGRVFNSLVQALILPGLQDTQCGFKLFPADLAHAAFGMSKVDGFAFDVEILSIVRSLGERIAEVPVEWHDSPRSTVRPFTDVPQMLVELVRIRRATRRSRAVADHA